MQALAGYDSDSSVSVDVDSEASIAHLKPSASDDFSSSCTWEQSKARNDDENDRFNQPNASKEPGDIQAESIVPMKRKHDKEVEQMPIKDKLSNAYKVLEVYTSNGIQSTKFNEREPEEDTPIELDQKIKKWKELQSQGIHFNDRLLNTHAFKNPMILDKMQSFLKLDPEGTNFPSKLFDIEHVKKWPNCEVLANEASQSTKTKSSTPKNAKEAVSQAKKALGSNFTTTQDKSQGKKWASRKRRI